MVKKKKLSPELKTRVALVAIWGDGMIEELAQNYGLHPTMITKWKKKLLAG